MKIFNNVIFIVILFVFSGCVSTKTLYLRGEMARTENKLGVSLKKSDNLELFVNSASWLGTKYKYGGTTKNGVDCSGFTNAIYQEVYGKQLERSSDLIYKKNCKRIRKGSLKPGDLVFFRTGSSKKIDHVGIYLKQNRFIHASTKGGVRVDSMNDKYYKLTYYRSGRVR